MSELKFVPGEGEMKTLNTRDPTAPKLVLGYLKDWNGKTVWVKRRPVRT